LEGGKYRKVTVFAGLTLCRGDCVSGTAGLADEDVGTCGTSSAANGSIGVEAPERFSRGGVAGSSLGETAVDVGAEVVSGTAW